MSIEIKTEWYVLTCYLGDCRAQWAIPDAVDQRNRADKSSFYCPNGHGQSYRGKTDKDRLREKERELENAQRRIDNIAERKAAVERRLSAQKGVATKLRKRAANGVCPCCTRTFKDLAQHMKSQHPEFADDR